MTLKVLLIEDQKPTQALLQDLLAEVSGFEVVGAAPGESQATDWMLRNPRAWDLAIIDLLLDDGSGFSVVRRARSFHADCKLVVFSDFVSPAVRERCLDLGADDAIPKAAFAELRNYLEGLRSANADSVRA